MRVRCGQGAGRRESKDFSIAYKSDGCDELGVGGVRGAGIFCFSRYIGRVREGARVRAALWIKGGITIADLLKIGAEQFYIKVEL